MTMVAEKLGKIMLLTAVLATAMNGCIEQKGITAGDATLPAGEDSAGFFDRISSHSTVTENDAMRGMLYLLDGQDKANTFGQRVRMLQGKDILGKTWGFDANRPLTKGKFAFMIYQAANVPGGVILTVAGPTQRYCLRELQYRGMMAEGAFYSKVTGLEFIAVISRADEYIQTGRVSETMSPGSEY